ncbi:hypothetical protein P152DRAFT_306612 [Eremomyces bilateralis CBS 781.70]|uniref:Uncharacterized protein n=1 Tax=Eremomyces bilateralis CBS 781.70 TaxID=1392243 RepID=A0A6G1G518_9PEZI|nr:uncharacterized protein P152DRAFT_306612 [Eremomyces bilateralis CBS 781.70]KAF1813144.1 hypothetical protein P152DRAFT_306612 [Eremomyces bilateralis CBS 781.70]
MRFRCISLMFYLSQHLSSPWNLGSLHASYLPTSLIFTQLIYYVQNEKTLPPVLLAIARGRPVCYRRAIGYGTDVSLGLGFVGMGLGSCCPNQKEADAWTRVYHVSLARRESCSNV